MLEVLVDQHRCDDQDDEVLEQQQGKRSKAKNKTIFMTLEDFSLLNLCILIECNLWNVITLQNNFLCGKSSLTKTKCIYRV